MWLTLAEAARCLGYHESTVQRHETNTRSLSDTDVENYSRLYKVSPHQLFKGLTTKQRA